MTGCFVVKLYLREWAEARGITPQQLAERAEMTLPTLSQIESGRRGWTSEQLETLARSLTLAPEQLLNSPRERH